MRTAPPVEPKASRKRPARRRRRVRKAPVPLLPVLFAMSIGLGGMLIALLLFPLFAGVGAGVSIVSDRLELESDWFKRIPHFPERSIIYADDGSVLARIYLDENRRVVRLQNVSEEAWDSVLAIEDDGFYEHGALNFTSLIRATLANLAAGDIVQGGSTITQQLVKNRVIADPSRTYERKFKEAALAMRVEQEYTKDEIFELYLNDVYFGNGVYGIGTASRFYFRKPAAKLSLSEGATLAGLIQSPETFDPLDEPAAALVRRNEVLERLAVLGWYPREQIDKLKARPIRLPKNAGVRQELFEPFFVYYLKNLILDEDNPEFDAFGKSYEQRRQTLFQGGLRVYTTLKPDWQRFGERAVRHGITGPEGLDASLVSVETSTGAIRTMVSGRDYKHDKEDLVWRGRRQVGSAFKPITLVAAFKEGISPHRVYSSRSPLPLPQWNNDCHCVTNAEGASNRGLLDLWEATAGSVNVVFAQLALDVGATDIVETAHELGMTAPMDAVPSITLGAEEVSTLDMATAFSTLANDGKHCEPFAVALVRSPDGVLYRHPPDCEQVIEADIAHLVTAMLQGVVDHGTGTAADDGMEFRPIAGKTGTAQDYTNLYFAGYTRQVSTAVWVGFRKGQVPLNAYFSSPFGGSVAAPIWNDFMVRATAGMPVLDFPEPPKPERRRLPRLVGLEEDEAIDKLEELGFEATISRINSLEDEGIVVAQSPAPEYRAIVGTLVRISVSTGIPPTVEVPDVGGMDAEEARAVLLEAGFRPRAVQREVVDPKKAGIVLIQYPRAGDEVQQNSIITITIGKLVPEDGDGGGGGGNGNGNGNGGGGGGG
ncbi:MAG TPA: transglycosylase domain-containing protein [Actinomycetota bacterium]|nr:transglycosylase domain-containing protein [Actinomycetota bacterium]